MAKAGSGTGSRPGARRERQHLRLSGALDAVHRARHLVGSLPGLAGGRLYDAELVVSELVTNALLHGRPPIDLYVSTSEGNVRVEVHDTGRTPPILGRPSAEAMTGRGLGMVGALSAAWGVEALPGGGKMVWAEIGADGAPGAKAGNGASLADDVEALLAAWTDELPEEPVYTVSLGPVATELLAAAKAHVDNVARELALVQEGTGSPGTWAPEDLAEIVDVISNRFAAARTELKREVAAAAAKGEPVTDVVFHLPASAASAGEKYLEVLDRVDRYARSAQMLTLASPAEHRLFRRWYVNSLVSQLRALQRGEAPAGPEPFQMVLAREVARLSPLEHMSARLQLLQKVTRRLSTVTDPRQLAQIVVDGAMEVPEVETARVRLLDDEDMLQSVAWRGRSNSPSEAVPAYSLHSDISGAEVVRTGRPVFIRSIVEEFRRRPDIMAFYQKDMSVHVMPLAAGPRSFGLLSLTFAVGALGDDVEIAVVSSLAGALSQALARAELAASERERREMLDFLARASQIMTSARDPAEVLEHFVHLAVPRLGDWCTVYLPDEGGQRLRRAAVAIEGMPHVADRLRDTYLEIGAAEEEFPHIRAFRTGEAQFMPHGVGYLLERVYHGLGFEELGEAVKLSAGICLPIVLRGTVVGVIALTFLDSRRQVTPEAREALQGLAERAAVALDNARHWAAREQLVQALVGALLPASPPKVAGVRFAARYLPAAGSVAGDWWEADVLFDGTVLVGLGDAAGHGVPAVSQMLELRHGARALASVEHSPAALLADLNRRLARSDTGFATAVYGRLSPVERTLVWASAGHPPPLRLLPDGRAELMSPSGGTALGSPVVVPMTDQQVQLVPGETIVFYSDGVVERRHQDLDEGIARLMATAQKAAGHDLEAMADALVRENCSHPVDDCCLFLVRVEGPARLP